VDVTIYLVFFSFISIPTHIPHWMEIITQAAMEETIQAAEITILAIKHVAVAAACNEVTVHSISTTVLKNFQSYRA